MCHSFIYRGYKDVFSTEYDETICVEYDRSGVHKVIVHVMSNRHFWRDVTYATSLPLSGDKLRYFIIASDVEMNYDSL